MVELKTELAQVGDYDGYLVEIRYPDAFDTENEQTAALNTYLNDIGQSIGDDKLYVRPLGSEASQNFLNRLDRQPDPETMPWLVVLDTQPKNVEPGQEVLTLQLGQLDSEEEVVAALREAQNALNSEQFIQQSSPSQQAEWMQRALSQVTKENVSAAGGVVALIQFLPM